MRTQKGCLMQEKLPLLEKTKIQNLGRKQTCRYLELCLVRLTADV